MPQQIINGVGKVGFRPSTITPPSIVTNGLVLNLDAGNTSSYPGSGAAWYDISGNNRNGTLINGPAFNSANGGSIVFDGTNDYVSTNYYGYHNFFTIVAWVKAGVGLGDSGFILNKNSYWAQNTNNWPVALAVSNDGTTANLTISNGSCYNLSCGAQVTGPLTVGTWNCIIATRDANNVKIYINGVLKQSAVFTGNIGSSIHSWAIGRASVENSGGTGKSYFKGNIGRVMLYDNALSDTQVLQNYNATKSRFGL